MPWDIPDTAAADIAAAFLQGAVTIALALLCAHLWRVYRKRHYLVWAVAWSVYSLRIVAIVSFLVSGDPHWLFWHQVTTGWTALALLYGALVIARGTIWRRWYIAFVAFPVLWSYFAIYRLDSFLLAAWPAVGFLSGATLFTAWAFERHHRQAGSAASRYLALMFVLWAIHHLDYPLLRAQGVWTPWGYYVDIVLLLGVGMGTQLLVQEDLRRGLLTLSGLASVLQARGGDDDLVPRLLNGLLTLPAVRGSALVVPDEDGVRVVQAAGTCSQWTTFDPVASRAAIQAIHERRPTIADVSGEPHRYVAALPVLEGESARGALVVVSNARDPFAALDESYLMAVGHQVGAALAHADLTRRLAARTADLSQLAGRMVGQHEDERRRLSRELHDETAQVLAALNMQIGLAREAAGDAAAAPLDRASALIADGIRGIRRVTERLRPTLLDDLGLDPALRGLIDDFRQTHAIDVSYEAPDRMPPLSTDAELALFRALQEALANVARHAAAHRVHVRVEAIGGEGRLMVTDDGRGFDPARSSGTGLVGMRERIEGLGGRLEVSSTPGQGTVLALRVPVVSP